MELRHDAPPCPAASSPTRRYRLATTARPLAKLLLLFVILPIVQLPAAEPFDWNAASQEIRALAQSQKTTTPEFSRKLEAWYAALQYPLTIDTPRENFGYMLALLAAGAPGDGYRKTLTPGAPIPASREEAFLQMAQRADCQKIPFDPAAWKTLPPFSKDRYKMLKSYLAAQPAVGATPATIQAALGAPTSETADAFTYQLGPDPSTLGPDILTIRFEVKDGKVSAFTYRGE